MRKISPYWLLCVLLMSGCRLNQGPDELERLVKEDSTFKKMIVQRDQVYVQIQQIKDDLLKKKQATDAETEKLRTQYELYAKTQNRRIDQYRATIEANRTLLKNEITASEIRVESKLEELEGYKRTMADVQKVLKESRGITLPSSERKKWDERIMILNEKIRPLTDEIQDLKLQIRLKKQKIGYLD